MALESHDFLGLDSSLGRIYDLAKTQTRNPRCHIGFISCTTMEGLVSDKIHFAEMHHDSPGAIFFLKKVPKRFFSLDRQRRSLASWFKEEEKPLYNQHLERVIAA